MNRVVSFISLLFLANACSPVTVASTPEEEQNNNNSNNNNNNNNNSNSNSNNNNDNNNNNNEGEGWEIQAPISVSIPSSGPGACDREGVRANLYKVILETFKWFSRDAQNLQSATQDYYGALGTDDASAALDDAKDAFSAAMDTWQVAEVMKMGPATHRGDGKGIRDDIYGWRVGVARCRVDHGVADYNQDGASYSLNTSNASYYGLDALEYLLFNTNTSTVCGTEAEPDGSPPSSFPSGDDLVTARAGYAMLTAEQLAIDAQSLVSEWTSFEDTFLNGTFNSDEQSPLTGDQMVYNALALYSDKMMKEQKIGAPFGIQKLANVCAGKVDKQICKWELEAIYTVLSKEYLQKNMLGFRMLYHGVGPDGTEGPGFQDALVCCDSSTAEGVPPVAADIESNLNSVSGTFRDIVEGGDSNKWGENFYKKVMGLLTGIFRSDIPGLSDCPYIVPNDMAGDTDGG